MSSEEFLKHAELHKPENTCFSRYSGTQKHKGSSATRKDSFMLRLRPWLKNDFQHLQTWIPDRRTHALWAADKVPFPLSQKGFSALTEHCEQDSGGTAWTCTKSDGIPVGCFLLSIREKNNSAFVAHVIIDPELRGKGYGTLMMKLLLKYAFEIAGVESVKLSVFDCNPAARKCYENAGFHEVSYTPDAFRFEKEVWGRFLYTAEAEKRV